LTRLIHVFAGPSLPAFARPAAREVVFHGPVAQGDVYGLTEERPLAIGIVDGYFERVAAVWHKEILWALSRGIHVFGAASMGALRAAELFDFGMVGVGEIFQKFASGALNDDDEVTVVHGSESDAYRLGSEAMVNLRATLARAEAVGVLLAEQSALLAERAKSMFYPDRNYSTLVRVAGVLLGDQVAASFSTWLARPENRIDLKRKDALELIHTLLDFRETGPHPKRVPWEFQPTDAWDQIRRGFPQRPASLQHGRSSDLATDCAALAR